LRVGSQVFRDDDVVTSGKVVENLLANLRVRLDAYERWLESPKVEARQRLRLVKLDINRQEVDTLYLLGCKEIVQRDGFRCDGPLDVSEAVREFPVA